MPTPCKPLDLAALGRLEFQAPDLERFPALALAHEALAAGGARPAVLNAANEIAVAAFLEGRIGFLDIAATVRKALDRCDPAPPACLDDVFAIDAEARATAKAVIELETV
jgi:1-deoxy-D-xylulose-5-phosphate reductoisomerase